MSLRRQCVSLLSLAAALLFGPMAAFGQAAATTPAGAAAPSVGFSLPSLGGSLDYALTASEVISNGFYQSSGVSAYTNFGGDLAYLSKSERHPFSAVYSGGVLVSNSAQSSTFYQNLAFSQVLNTKHCDIVVSDSVNCLPQGPTLGLSGVAGVGDLGVNPIAIGADPGVGILTTYGPRVSNSTTLGVSRTLTGRLSVQGSGSLSLLRFIGDNSQLGLSDTSYTGSGGLSYRLNGRSSITGNYSYSDFTYSGTSFSFSTQSGVIAYSRQLRPDLSFSVSAGPQYSSATIAGVSSSNTTVTAGASLSYLRRPYTYNLSFSRGINGGSGVIPGATSDSLTLNASRLFGHSWNTSANVSYSHSTSIPELVFEPFTSDAVAVGGQVSRAFTRRVSGFGSYSLVDQRTSGSLPANAFSGLYQVIGFGLTYSPSAIDLARQ